VVARAGVSVELAELVSFLRDRGLATFKLPQHLILVDDLPKTSTGKVRKGELVREAMSRAGVG
jgi:non-ribosomal peptide synthetase component E (peptide arylation enzyme)